MSRKLLKLGFAILLLAGLVLGLAAKDSVLASTTQADTSAKIEGALLDKFATDGKADFVVSFTEKADLSAAYSMDWDARGHFVYDTLTATAQRVQASAKSALDNFGFTYKTFIAANELSVTSGNLEAATAIAALPEVSGIRAPGVYHIDPVAESTSALLNSRWAGDLLANHAESTVMTPNSFDWGIVDTGASQFWGTFGVQGGGILVANIDTGVQWDHPAVVNQFNCPGDPSNPACWSDPSNICGGSACDNVGHGTHTMGTMVGSDDPGLLHQVGMAPDAQWIACKGCETNSCSFDALNSCADWILAPDGNPDNRPNVVNNSWGGGSGDPWYLANVQAWVAAGIFPAFSAGNSYTCNSLGDPGDYQESFASAAHDVYRNIADFSSKGPSVFGHDPYTKPNISAPGVDVCSSVPTNGWDCSYSGTSMASPHTAGAVALLWSCNPGLIGNIDQTFQILQDNADTPPDGTCGAPPDGEGNYTFGYGYLNTVAMGNQWCGDIGNIQGHVYQEGTLNPIEDAQVYGDNQSGPGSFSVHTDETGFYSTAALVGTYDMTASHYGYLPESATVEIIVDETTTQDFSLAQTPMSIVDGMVTDSITGWPLYARIDIDGYPDSPVFTDPTTGAYSVSLANGVVYTFHVTAWTSGYIQEDRTLPVLLAPRTEDFALNVDTGACSAPGYEPAVTYFEDFENSNGGFAVDPSSVNSTWSWGVPTSGPGSAHSGVKVWATNLSGNYLDYSDDFLVSPNINLSSLGGGFKLDWWQWLQTESCCDPAYVQVSKDGGATWTTVYQAQGDVNLSWAEHSVTLDSSYAVANFRVRFYLHSDLSVTYAGWYIDDVAILGECNPQDGGLVVGNVYDMNSGLPLPGSMVTADTGASVVVQNTPDDLNVDDAFYAMFVANPPIGLQTVLPAGELPVETLAHVPAGMSTKATGAVGEAISTTNPEAVLWDQPITASGYGGVSDFWTNYGIGAFSADDFMIVDPGGWQIDSIYVDGFDQAANLTRATGLTWLIYPDDGGVPAGYPGDGSGAEVWSYTTTPADPAVIFNESGWQSVRLNVNLAFGGPINLPPGHYWLTFYPSLDGSVAWYYWYFGSTNNLNHPQLIDPANYFAGGFTSWTDWMSLSPYGTDMCFRLEGNVVSGTEHDLTATHNQYSPDTETVNVPQWGVALQDFYLGTGHLAFTPPSIEVTLDMSDSSTVEGTLSNDGSGAATWQINEQDRGFTPNGWIESLPMPAPAGTAGAAHNGELAANVIQRQPYVFHGNAVTDASIIVYCDDDQHSPSYVEQTLQELGLSYTFYGNPGDPGPLDLFTNDVNAGGWDLVILAQDGWIYLDGREYTAVANHIASGGAAIVYSWGIGYGPTQYSNPLWAAMGAQFQTWLNSPTNLYWWDPSFPIFEGVPEFTNLNNLGYLAYGAKMSLLGDPSTGLGGFTVDPAAGEAGVILREDMKTLYRGLTDNLNSADQDSDGVADAEEWWLNSVDFMLNPAIDVPWLSENPTSGTLEIDGSTAVQVTIDAGVPEVTQPGEYYATLRVMNDTPYGPLTIPVTMTVSPPETYGKLEGAVYSLGYCDNEMIPLEGAVVVVTGNTGDSWTLETNDTGYYQLWLDENNTPVTIDVTYEGNENGQATGVVIVGGQTTTENFSLRWLQPCLTVAPLSLEVTQGLGEQTTLPLTITNEGASPATWEFQEADGGYTPSIHIPRFTGTIPVGNEETSIGHAPNIGASTPPQPIPAEIARILGSQAIAVDVNTGYNMVTFDTDTPGNWTVLWPLPGNQYFGGDFIAGDTVDLYVVDYGTNHLYTVNVETGDVTDIGPAMPGGGESWTGLSGAADGTLYGSATTCSSSTLYTLDPDTGTTSAVGPITNGACIIDIAATSDGMLFGIDIVTDNLLSIDPATGAGTVIGSLGVSANFAQGLDYDPESGQLFWAAYTSSGELRVIDMETGASMLIGGFPDGAEVDSLAFPISGGDIVWLTEDPTSGTIPPDGGSVTADVTFDSSTVTQPGTYNGTLTVKSDDPVNNRMAVPVTMNVSAGPDYGHLEGVVTSLGYCDENPAPLEGAIVTIEGGPTLETDADGHYSTWLLQGSYDLTVTADDHTVAYATMVIVGQQSTVEDIALRSLEPCVSVDPTSYEVWMVQGSEQSLPLTLFNNGAADSSFQISDFDTTNAAPKGWEDKQWNGIFSDNVAAFLTTPSQPKVTAGTGALLIQDSPSWGSTAFETLLQANSIPYDLINSSQIATWNFTPYKMIIVPSVQGSGFNTLYNADLTKFETFIDAGGIMILDLSEQSLDIPYKAIPFGGTNNYGGYDYNYIIDPTYPIFAGVPNPYSGTWASHDYITGLLPTDTVLVTAGSTPGGDTVMIERKHGGGLLVAGGQTFEYGWAYGQDAGLILNNMVPFYYSYELLPDALWLEENPTTGTIAADSTSAITVTFIVTDGMPLGDYTGRIDIVNDDNEHGLINIPVTLHVVNPEAPVASFTTNSPVVVRDEMVFTFTGFGGYPPATEYMWDFGDGTLPLTVSTAEPVTHVYTTYGEFEVTLIVCNDVDCSTATETVTVLPRVFYLPLTMKH